MQIMELGRVYGPLMLTRMVLVHRTEAQQMVIIRLIAPRDVSTERINVAEVGKFSPLTRTWLNP